MKLLSFKKTFLTILIVAIFSLGLTGCDGVIIVTPTNTGTVKIEVSGDFSYDILMDGEIKFENKLSGTYTIYNVKQGYHDFEAVDTMGASFGSAKERVYVSANEIAYVYLDVDEPTVKTGTLKVVIMDDPGWHYEVYLGGNQLTGEYLGKTSGSSISGQNSETFPGISTGSQTVFVISEDGKYSKYRYPYITAGKTTTINVYVQ